VDERQETKGAVLRSISIPRDVYDRVLDVVADRARRGESGGFSAAIRELMRPELMRRSRRRAADGLDQAGRR
jgi:hypothetical protein